MASTITVEAQKRAQDAIHLLDAGDIKGAEKLLIEASHLDKNDKLVQSAWDRFHDESSGAALPALCNKFIQNNSEEGADEVLDYLNHHPSISPDNRVIAFKILLQYHGDIDAMDQVTEDLLKSSPVQTILADALVQKPTVTFNTIFERGDDSMDAQTNLLLDGKLWNSEAERIAAERDVFQLALAQLMKAGQDYPERALKALSRLLGAEARNLNGLIDADGFDVILSNLDIRLPSKLRGQATLACAKLLQLSPDPAKKLISQCVVQRIEKPSGERLVQAFSAAAAVFPMAPDAAAELFMTSGFLPGFIKLVTKWRSRWVEQSALELLNAACMDSKCRTAIFQYCQEWLHAISGPDPSNNERRASQISMAHLVLEKLKDANPNGEKPSLHAIEDVSAQEERVYRFKSMIVNPQTPSSTKSTAIEGLAYASIQPHNKELLAQDPQFLASFISLMSQDPATALFGGLTVFANLTTYRPILSEEQKKLMELKAYANTSRPAEMDPLDADHKVSERGGLVMKAQIAPLINKHALSFSPATLLLAVQILNSLARETRNRGQLAQQGALKFLLQAYDRTESPKFSARDKSSIQLCAAHAMARILISVNPALALAASNSSSVSAVRPLASILLDTQQDSAELSSTGTRDLLPTFESLLALTNLASTNITTCEAIIRIAWAAIENLLLNQNQLVQRAAMELVCNLCDYPPGVAQFASEVHSPRRLQILVALADSEDLPTRRAAAGAMAMLTEWDEMVDRLLKVPSAIPRLVELVMDESEEVVIRGLVSVVNSLSVDQKLSKRVGSLLKQNKDLDKALERVYQTEDNEIKSLVLRVAKLLN